MNIFYKLIFIYFILFSVISYSQINGKCIDLSGKEIPYVNISVKGKSIGTVSNSKGVFNFENLVLKENDSLIFSHINFNTKIISFPLNIKEIELTSKVETLNEVVISNKKIKIKEKTVGTKTKSKNVLLFFTSKYLGAEIGKIIEVKKNKVYDLKNVKFNIAYFGFKSATLRINFYKIINSKIDISKMNLTDNIIKITKKGMVNFDLSNQYLSFENDFLVSIEWIDFEEKKNVEDIKEIENKTMEFSSTVFSGPFIHRNNTTLKWRKRKVKYNVGLGIHLDIEQYSK